MPKLAVCLYLNALDNIEICAQLYMIKNCVDSILCQDHSDPNTPPPQVSQNWVFRFLEKIF